MEGAPYASINNSLHFFAQKFSIKLVDKAQITTIKRVYKAGMSTLSEQIIHLALIKIIQKYE